MAREEDEKVRAGKEAERYVRVPGNAGEVGHSMLVHFSPQEIALVRKRAKARGKGVYEYVREAVLGESPDVQGDRPG